MSTYGPNGKLDENINPKAPIHGSLDEEDTAKKKGIRIDGFQQVVDMLEIADEEFRNSLLSRIYQSDREMGIRLKKALEARLS